ncbi:hypothetical protein TNCV_2167751 [Trichonephila clavipes]|nr:hypothetical protein TNCV_2167751 [Trichonephila clavipes]
METHNPLVFSEHDFAASKATDHDVVGDEIENNSANPRTLSHLIHGPIPVSVPVVGDHCRIGRFMYVISAEAQNLPKGMVQKLEGSGQLKCRLPFLTVVRNYEIRSARVALYRESYEVINKEGSEYKFHQIASLRPINHAGVERKCHSGTPDRAMTSSGTSLKQIVRLNIDVGPSQGTGVSRRSDNINGLHPAVLRHVMTAIPRRAQACLDMHSGHL